MERTEIVSLYKNTPADGTVVTVCGWAKNIRDSKNIGFIALSDGGCFKTLQVVLEAGKLANYEEVIHTGLYSSLRIVGRIVLTPQAKQPFELNADSVEILGALPRRRVPPAEKENEHGVSAHHAHPAPPHQHLQRRIPRAQRGCLRHPQVLPGERLHLLPLSPADRFRLRGCR